MKERALSVAQQRQGSRKGGQQCGSDRRETVHVRVEKSGVEKREANPARAGLAPMAGYSVLRHGRPFGWLMTSIVVLHANDFYSPAWLARLSRQADK